MPGISRPQRPLGHRTRPKAISMESATNRGRETTRERLEAAFIIELIELPHRPPTVAPTKPSICTSATYDQVAASGMRLQGRRIELAASDLSCIAGADLSRSGGGISR